MTATTAPAPSFTAPTADAVMAQAASENFPVALKLLGAAKRRQLLSLYGYARLVDDAGDEASGDRLALLDWIEADLDRIYAHERPEHPVLQTLQPTITALGLPDAPFRRLIDASRRDQTVRAYPTFDALLDYCRLSAAPVGELVLHVFGAATRERIRLSDRICAGLQVTEHLQDVAEDRDKGRVYLPLEDRERFGVGELAYTPEFRGLMAFELERAHALLSEGAPLIRMLRGAPALAVAGFVAGGRAALDAIAKARYDVLGACPRPSRRAFAGALLMTVRRRG
ncbi:MAG TPA: squalene synthase HpnC [Solirubrobacteraceae bacterium]|nr:squalene synthase HpnC [Solirubrobacteraceae bacterium]